VMNPNYLLRQSDILPEKCLDMPITVIGAGAIGSFTVLALSKMGFKNITVFDFDKVDDVNMSCQFYRYSDIGKPKVEALKDLIKDFTGNTISICNEPYEVGKFKGLVISAVDSMAVRKNIWKNQVGNYDCVSVIDPRMASEYAMLYTMDPNLEKDVKSYEKTLFSDEEGVQERCTARSTMYTVNMIAGHTAKAVKDIATKADKVPRIVNWDIGLNFHQCWS